MKDKCVFCTIGNEIDATFIKDYGNWVYRLSPSQFLLGVGVLVHKEHKEGLTSLSGADMTEALAIIKSIEVALKRSFSPDWFNYLQTNNSVRHFHFHIIPRYQRSVEFEGEVFHDKTFSGMPEESHRRLPANTVKNMISTIQGHL